MAHSLAAQGVQVDVATTDDDGPGARLKVPLGKRVEHQGYGIFHFRKQLEFYKVSLPFSRWMARHVIDYDLVHIHALFSYTSSRAAHHARRHNVPYLIRPLGVLNRWGMENRRRFVKALSFRFVEKPILRHAAAMHYTSLAEQTEAEATGATACPFVIPLGIDLSPPAQVPDVERFFQQYPQARGRRLLLFLSRIDAKKGIDVLLPAFAQVRKTIPDTFLVIAGDGPAELVKKYRDLAATVGVADAVVWAGFLKDADKRAAFAAATAFVLPSYSENFGIAAVEALAAGLPCVLSHGVAIGGDVASSGAGLVVPTEPEPLAVALVQILSDDTLREKCSANGPRLAGERFSLQAMGKNLLGVYQNILGENQVSANV